MTAVAPEPQVHIQRIESETLHVPIVGTTPLIIHRFSEKAKRQMLDAMQGRRKVKEPKDPHAEFEASLYKFRDGGAGFPAIGFKAATVGGARFYHGVTMTSLRQFMFFSGELGVDNQVLVRLEGDYHMREDVVTVGRGTDLRYRAEFPEWSTVLKITYIPSSITRDSILSLVDAGGLGVGVGEWRPEKKGDFGTYQIDTARGIEVVT